MQIIFAVLLSILTVSSVQAGAADPLFQDPSTLAVELTAPLGALVRERSKSDYSPGVLSYTQADGTPVNLDVQVRARGNFRLDNCDFPPLTLNFKKSQVEGTLFDQQNKLKMVTHCKITRRYEQSVVREYLAYRLLNLLTDQSYRVRLLQVTYIDSDDPSSRMVRSAFVIEHKNRLAARIGMEPLDIERTEVAALQPDELNLTSVFQYFIGNVDFSPIVGSNNECCHNTDLFGNGDDPWVAIPYDFDLSGIVNAAYAVPDRELGVERLGQRVYRGYCVNNGHVAASISRFQQAREAMYALVAAQEELEPSVRNFIARYMDGFYETIDDPEAVERSIVEPCI